MLFHRREIWLPTLTGWIVLIGLLALGVTALAWSANGLLALNVPVAGARVLVVEGWLDEPELVQAAAFFRNGHYARALTTGGPIEAWSDTGGFGNYAVRAASALRAQGLAAGSVVPVPALATTQDRTFHSAAAVHDWARRSGVSLAAVDVFTAGVHARRSRMLYRMALGPSSAVGVITSAGADDADEHWWRSSAGTKAVMGETLSLAWTWCCFWPPPSTD